MYNVIDSAWQAVNPAPPGAGTAGAAGKYGDYLTVLRYLTRHGYTQWTRYQPGSRFWPFQWIESGWLLALSVLLHRRDRLAGPPPRRLTRYPAGKSGPFGAEDH